MRLFVRVMICVLLAGLLTMAPALAQDGNQPMKMLLTFIPNVQFAPIYATIGAGYFAEAGLDVTVDYLNEPDVVDLIAAGEHDFGVVSGEQVILAVSQGRPVVFVYEWFQKYPVGLVYEATRQIESAQDLIGLRVGIPGRFGASYSGFTTLLADTDVAEAQIDLQEIGFNAPDVFCVGAVDAAVVYANNEPLQIQIRADGGECAGIEEVDVLLVSDVVDLVSNGIITSKSMLEENPELVRDVLAAFDRGLRLVINNPAAGYLLSADFVEGLPLSTELRAVLEELAQEQDEFLANNPDREAIAESRQQMLQDLLEQFDRTELVQFEVLLNTIEMWDADLPGHGDASSWENMQETLLMLGQLNTPVDLESIFTNDYLPDHE